MTIEELLAQIGLSDKEATMYITLLRHGNQPTSFLAKQAGFNRGTAYVILHQLLEKGLAIKSTKKKVQYFAPLDPQYLVSYLDRRKKEAEQGKQKVMDMMAQLTAITNPNTAKPKLEFFDGVDGAKTVLERTLQAKENVITAFQSIRDLLEFVGPDFLHDFSKRRAEAGYSVQAIRTREKDRQAFTLDERMEQLTTNSRERREVRYASEDLAFPMTMYIYDSTIAVISTKTEDFAAVIESPELAKMQRKLFELLWQSLEEKTVKVGILHSLTGTMAISERSLVDAELMAIDEVNAAGGVLGKQIEPIVVDSASDPEKFAKEAEALVAEEGVCTVFGGWTSASRKTMLPVFEKHNHLLWYPVEYEGLEESSNVMYIGPTFNQHIQPALDYMLQHVGGQMFLVGSDYVYPRCVNERIKAYLTKYSGEVVGEAYEPLGGKEFDDIVQQIVTKKPSVIINTINGDSNVAFYHALRSAGVTPDTIPTLSFSISEEEISRMDASAMAGDFVSACYFQSVSTKQSKDFVDRFQKRYGSYRVVNDPIVSAYNAVHLCAQAINKADSVDPQNIRSAALGLEWVSPCGKVTIDADNQHLHRKSHLGRIRSNGQIEIIHTTDSSVAPEPYPAYRSKKDWNAFVQSLYEKWGKKWEA